MYTCLLRSVIDQSTVHGFNTRLAPSDSESVHVQPSIYIAQFWGTALAVHRISQQEVSGHARYERERCFEPVNYSILCLLHDFICDVYTPTVAPIL